MRKRSGEQGAVMVLAAVTLTLLLLFAGLALDFGRAHLLRAQLQTAVDASSLAGALQVIPYAELEIGRWEAVTDICYDPITKKPYSCRSWERVAPARVSGTEWQLLYQNGWRAAAGAQCQWPYRCDGNPQIVREWLVLPPSTVAVAENTFYENATWPGGNFAPRITELAVTIEASEAQVTTTATITVPTSFLKLVGLRQLTISRTGSAIPVRR